MKKIIVLLAAIFIALEAFGGNHEYARDILYKGSPDAYTDKMCRIDVAMKPELPNVLSSSGFTAAD